MKILKSNLGYFIAGFLYLALMGLLVLNPKHRVRADTSRVERLSTAYLDDRLDGTVVQVFHDRESGIEFICTTRFHNGGGCVLTGRVWKSGK